MNVYSNVNIYTHTCVTERQRAGGKCYCSYSVDEELGQLNYF